MPQLVDEPMLVGRHHALGDFQLLRGQRIVVMFSMELRRIVQINLQDETMVSIGGSLQDLVGVVNPLKSLLSALVDS